MSCNHPYKGFRTGYKTDNGKDDFVLVMQDLDIDSIDVKNCKKEVLIGSAPHKVVDGHVFLTDPVEIPCGVCVGCRIDRAKEWKIRNCLELQEYPECYFVTLTYDDRHLPRLQDGRSVLVKKDFQNFLKRLRNSIGFVRYFACGEYGDLTKRAHFHALLYCHLEDLQLYNVRQWTSGTIAKAWKFGQHVIESVEPGNIAYVAGYCEKKFKAEYEDFPVKPFLMMSTKPAIGLTYFLKRFPRFEKDMHVYGVFSSQKKGGSATVPKAFRRRLENFPWYQDWKAAAKLAGENMKETLKVVYRCADQCERHFIQDRLMKQMLEKKRNEKI